MWINKLKTPSTNGLWNNLQKHWDSTEVDAQDDEFCGAPPSAMAMDVVANGATDSHWCWPESDVHRGKTNCTVELL